MTYISEQLKSALVGSQELREWFRSNCRVTDSVDGYSTSTNPRLLLIALGGDAFVNAVNAARVDGSLIDVRIAAPLPAPSGVKVEGTTAVRIVKPNLGHKSVK